eukprot:TRINITY_DN28965_c0_g1_i1.p1 TRINITY_DN28965_c0_g1~~TRINITY_DN28965_c0_g1_i1.p1  ORF type:complete len:244 (-),score=23.78 TRINITY_DN28965_c0_g1_i1:57-788(-)
MGGVKTFVPEDHISWGGPSLPPIRTLNQRYRAQYLDRYYLPKYLDTNCYHCAISDDNKATLDRLYTAAYHGGPGPLSATATDPVAVPGGYRGGRAVMATNGRVEVRDRVFGLVLGVEDSLRRGGGPSPARGALRRSASEPAAASRRHLGISPSAGGRPSSGKPRKPPTPAAMRGPGFQPPAPRGPAPTSGASVHRAPVPPTPIGVRGGPWAQQQQPPAPPGRAYLGGNCRGWGPVARILARAA